MKTFPLWLIGLILVVAASVINGQLISHQIGGIIRDLFRLLILIGLALFLIGMFQKLIRKNK